MVVLGTLPHDKAIEFITANSNAYVRSMSTKGVRVATDAEGAELLQLQLAFTDQFPKEPDKPGPTSIPVLSPGITDPMPCIPCLKEKQNDWWNHPGTISEYRATLRRMIEGAIAMPECPPMEGSGIIYVGGGRYWPGIAVGIHLLREIGCFLPIEVWYRGEQEPVDPSMVEGMDVTFIDIVEQAEKSNEGVRTLGGWEAKLWALTHTTLESVLYLDADAYCVSDPTSLIESNDFGFGYWQDLASSDARMNWQATYPGKVPSNFVKMEPVQGGQLFINRRQVWRLLIICHWVNQHSDFYYHHVYGDQDTWRLLLQVMTDIPRVCWGPAPWKHPAFLIPHPETGRDFIVHRCQSKLYDHEHVGHYSPNRLPHSQPFYHLPMESRVFTLMAKFIPPKSPARVFDTIYRKQLWGIGSGAGSNPVEMVPWVEWLNDFIARNGITSVLDVGCGTGDVAAKIEVAEYTGCDVVESLIRQLRESQPHRNWFACDFYRDRHLLPSADVMILKDVLHHWTNEMIISFLDWVMMNAPTKWSHVIVCGDNQQVESGADCPLGMYRALDPAMAPLNLYHWHTYKHYLHKSIMRLETNRNV